jgi:hypothetical protein
MLIVLPNHVLFFSLAYRIHMKCSQNTTLMHGQCFLYITFQLLYLFILNAYTIVCIHLVWIVGEISKNYIKHLKKCHENIHGCW